MPRLLRRIPCLAFYLWLMQSPLAQAQMVHFAAFSTGIYSEKEGKPISIYVQRDGDTSLESSVSLTTENGLAVEGADYAGRRFDVTFGVGETLAQVTIATLSNSLADGDRSFVVRLSEPIHCTLSFPSETLVSILDDEIAPPGPNVDLPFSPYAAHITGPMLSLLIQSDGRIVAATSTAVYRLNTNGTLDPFFIPFASAKIKKILQIDDKIMVGRVMPSAENLIRLNSDGTRDKSFTFTNKWVIEEMQLSSNGTLLVAGWDGDLRLQYIASVGNDGTILNQLLVKDSNGPSYRNTFPFVALPGGQFLVAFDRLTRPIARLNPDGSVDPGFAMKVPASVYALVRLSDGWILAGTQTNLIRLNADGAIDPYFQSDFHGLATKIMPLADGRILVGGQASYDRFGLEPLMLLKSNGVADKSFAPDFSGAGLLIVNDFDFNQNGELFAAGQFVSATMQGTNAYGPDLVGFHLFDPPPMLSRPQRREGAIIFKAATFNPILGEKYAVEFSEDLSNWVVLSTNVTSNTSAIITATIESQNRFFRVRRQP